MGVTADIAVKFTQYTGRLGAEYSGTAKCRVYFGDCRVAADKIGGIPEFGIRRAISPCPVSGLVVPNCEACRVSHYLQRVTKGSRCLPVKSMCGQEGSSLKFIMRV